MRLNKGLVLGLLAAVIIFAAYVSFIRIRDGEMFSLERISGVTALLMLVIATVTLLKVHDKSSLRFETDGYD